MLSKVGLNENCLCVCVVYKINAYICQFLPHLLRYKCATERRHYDVI